MANKKIPRGWGPTRIKIGATYYSFDPSKADVIVREVWNTNFINNVGRRLGTVIGYWIDFDFVLTELQVHSTYSISRAQDNINNFLNAYYALAGDSKEIWFTPFADTGGTWEEAENNTTFLVTLTQAPLIKPFKTARKLGTDLIIKATTVAMIPVEQGIVIPYRTTTADQWFNVGLDTGMVFKDAGSDEDAEFKESGSNKAADAKYTEITP
jgi:hypothetical protein